jgi:Family of unknown function (DUF6527)
MTDVVRHWKYPDGSANGLNFECPACNEFHQIRLKPEGWQWNGSLDKPTFSPSVKVTGVKKISDETCVRIMAGEKIDPIPKLCHSFVKDGKIEFLSDCLHEQAGKTLDIPPWPHGDKWDYK